MNPFLVHSAFPPEFPPAWASAWGEDEFGIYAEFVVADVVQRCRWMPPGRFLMGAPESEEGRDGKEGPQHEVMLSGFWLADTACTQALWLAVIGENQSYFKDAPMQAVMRKRPGNFENALVNPVEMVSWHQCRVFFGRLNALVPGLFAWFPSEAQWEYACRAGTTSSYSFGVTITHEQVHFGPGRRGNTVPVSYLPANPWGLYEMHGNVWEWCSDWFGAYAAEPQVDPEGPDNGWSRVLRGGSWFDDAHAVRSVSRSGGDSDHRSRYIGLRVAPGRAGPVEPA